MLYEYCINNNLSKDQILAVLKEYDSIKKFKTNSIADIKSEIAEFGLEYVSKKYDVSENYLKETFSKKHDTEKKVIRTGKKYLKLTPKLEKEINFNSSIVEKIEK